MCVAGGCRRAVDDDQSPLSGERSLASAPPGVVLMSAGPPNRRQQVEAALLYAGAGAVLTGADAAARHAVRRMPAETNVHVLVPIDRRRQNRPGVLVERTTRLPEPTVRDGLSLVPVHRAVLDSARRHTDVDVVAPMLAEAVQRGLCGLGGLRRELDAGSQRGSALDRDVLDDLDAGVWSAAERRARRLALRGGLPQLIWNPRVFAATGRYLGRPDAWADDVALAWQIDSFEHHMSPQDFAATTARDARMTAAGIVVINTVPAALRQRPREVIDTLAAAYQQARRRPRPDVSAVHEAAA